MQVTAVQECPICLSGIKESDFIRDFRRFGIGLVHVECEEAARAIAYAALGDEWGLERIDGQCLHAIGNSWADAEYEWHDYWDCRIPAKPRIFDHMIMWRVLRGSLWIPLAPVGSVLMTSEPYIGDFDPVSDDSAIWYEIGATLDVSAYPEKSIHYPGETTLLVWTRPKTARRWTRAR